MRRVSEFRVYPHWTDVEAIRLQLLYFKGKVRLVFGIYLKNDDSVVIIMPKIYIRSRLGAMVRLVTVEKICLKNCLVFKVGDHVLMMHLEKILKRFV